MGSIAPIICPLALAVSRPFAGLILHDDKGGIPFVKRYVIYPFSGKRASLVVCICKHPGRVFAPSGAATKEFFKWI
jgi:hypothetical protein